MGDPTDTVCSQCGDGKLQPIINMFGYECDNCHAKFIAMLPPTPKEGALKK